MFAFACCPESAGNEGACGADFRAPAVQIFGGYSYLRFESKPLGFSSQLNLNGGNLQIALPNIYNGLGFALDLSAHTSSEMEEFNFLIGPQYTYEVKSMHIFGHALFGRARDRLRMPGSTQIEPSSIGGAVALGGGIDIPLTDKISVRPIQADYLITGAFGERFHNLRISTGLIYRFGKR
jgi:hypothetical protein